MAQEEPQISVPVELVSYEECPHCSGPYERFPDPLPHYAAHAENPDVFDWNLYYWGFDWYDHHTKWRAIKYTLPHSITDRIPLEIHDHIIHFLRGSFRQGALYSCALVCCAWYHSAQPLLCRYISVDHQVQLSAVARQRNFFVGSITRRLDVNSHRYVQMTSKQWLKTLPMVASKRLAHQVQCLSLYNFYVPYDRSITIFMSRFSRISHLKLSAFKLYSFEDLRRIICALPSLLDLELMHGDTVSEPIYAANASQFMPKNRPHLQRTTLQYMASGITVPLSWWISSTDICSTCTELEILIGKNSSESCVTWISPIFQKIGSKLESLKFVHYGDCSNIGTCSFVFWNFC